MNNLNLTLSLGLWQTGEGSTSLLKEETLLMRMCICRNCQESLQNQNDDAKGTVPKTVTLTQE